MRKKAFAKRNFKKHRLCLNAIDVTNLCAKVAVTVREHSHMTSDVFWVFLTYLP